MILTVLLSASVVARSSGTVFIYGLLAGLMVALALSSQRWLLWYLLGAIAYWLSVEVIQSLLINWLPLSDWNSYVTAMGISWLPLFGWILYRVLRYDYVSDTMQQEHELAAARYIEHTPIYDDDYKPRFE